MKINNQIKEIEKGCGKTIWVHNTNIPTDHYRCGDNKNLCSECEEKFKLLKQFQKEINELQEDVDNLQKNYANLDICDKEDVINLIKKRFGEFI